MKPIPARLSDTYQAINTLLKIYEGYKNMPPAIFKLYNRYQHELIHLQNEPMKSKKDYPNRDKTIQYPPSIMPYGFVKDEDNQELMQQVAQLRDQGYTYPQINEQLDAGMSDNGLRKAHYRYAKKSKDKVTDIT